MDLDRRGYERAVERAPDDPVVRNDFAVVLCFLGEYEAAFAQINRAVELRADLTAAYVNGAVIAGYLRGCEAALPWLDEALRLQPDNVQAMLLRAQTLAKLGRAPEALALAERAVSLDPREGQAHETLAISLQAARRYDEALAAFERAQSLSKRGEIGVRKATLLLQRGKKPEALAELDRVLSLQPNLAMGWFTRAFATDFKLEDRDLAQMERVLQSAHGLSFDDRVQLEFAIGRAYFANGNLPIAFARLGRANAMKRSSMRYDVAEHERYVEHLIERYSPDVFERSRNAGADSMLPIFVVGMPRSGTSLVEQILASHPKVFGAGEISYVAAIAQDVPLPEPARLRELGRGYVEKLSAFAPDAKRIVDKMPLNFFHAGLIHLILPRARIVHCRREPMDTGLSCYLTLFDEHMEFSYDQSDIARFYRAYARLMAHWRSVLPPESFIEVDYETLIDDLKSQVSRLLEFCGLPWDDRCLAFHAAERTVHTASTNQVRRPLYRTSVGRWRECLPYLQVLAEGLAT